MFVRDDRFEEALGRLGDQACPLGSDCPEGKMNCYKHWRDYLTADAPAEEKAEEKTYILHLNENQAQGHRGCGGQGAASGQTEGTGRRTRG